MRKFVFFLADSPGYPNEIYAESIAEAKSLILESVPDESHILKILDAEKMQPHPQSPQNQNIQMSSPMIDNAVSPEGEIDPDDFNNASDFLNNVMNVATRKALEIEQNEAKKEIKKDNQVSNDKSDKIVEKPVEQKTVIPQVDSKPRYFEEAGIQFKFEAGKLYKKSWINVSDGEKPDFRIVNKKTKKLVDIDKYALEKLEWTEIKS